MKAYNEVAKWEDRLQKSMAGLVYTAILVSGNRIDEYEIRGARIKPPFRVDRFVERHNRGCELFSLFLRPAAPDELYRVDLSHFSSPGGFPFKCTEEKKIYRGDPEPARQQWRGGLLLSGITKLTFAAQWRLYIKPTSCWKKGLLIEIGHLHQWPPPLRFRLSICTRGKISSLTSF